MLVKFFFSTQVTPESHLPAGVSLDLDLRNLPDEEKTKILEDLAEKLSSHTCLLCGKKYDTEHQLEIHFWDHTKTHFELVCLICNETFIDKIALQNHVRAHTGGSPVNPNQPMFKIRKLWLKFRECHFVRFLATIILHTIKRPFKVRLSVL